MPLLFAKKFSVPYHTTPQTERLSRYNHLHLPKKMKTSERQKNKPKKNRKRGTLCDTQKYSAGTFRDP